MTGLTNVTSDLVQFILKFLPTSPRMTDSESLVRATKTNPSSKFTVICRDSDGSLQFELELDVSWPSTSKPSENSYPGFRRIPDFPFAIRVSAVETALIDKLTINATSEFDFRYERA